MQHAHQTITYYTAAQGAHTVAGRIHADTDDDNFQSGNAAPVDTSYAFRTAYARNKDRLTELTRVSEFNTGMMQALKLMFEQGAQYERDYVSQLEEGASSVTRIVTPDGKLIRTITSHRAG